MVKCVKIHISTTNAAFEGENFELEVARILRLLADDFEDGSAYDNMRLFDENGNCVGLIDIKDSA